MNRALLFALIFAGVLIAGSAVYRFGTRDSSEAKPVLSDNQEKIVLPVESPSAVQSAVTTPSAVSAAPDTDEDIPKPASASRQNFESEEDTNDSDDSVTIEVEPEEE